MGKIEHDVLTGEETFKGEHVAEEMEFYDMGGFETKLLKKLDHLETKLDSIAEEVEDNNHRLKNIQFNFLRALILRVLKLALIGGIIFYVYNNFISPIIIGASDKYYQVNNLLDRVNTVNSNTESFGETIDKLFPSAGDALDTLRPGTGEVAE